MSAVLWLGFILFIGIMLYIDLAVINRKASVISTTQAFRWAGFCIVLALLFNVGVFYIYEYHLFEMGHTARSPQSGEAAALQFFAGWLIEQSLSLDNIFVIALIFAYFQVPLAYQHRVLFWGILGALVMRGIMIALGAALIQQFEWFTYVFGGLLLVTALKMFTSDDEKIDPEKNYLIRLARKFYPVSSEFDGPYFFTSLNGQRAMTPLFLVLLVIESTDMLFAFDSVPAIFAITNEPFLVFTSNIFAILNLRSLYFVLASLLDRFKYMKSSLVFVLAFVGIKMLLEHHLPITTAVSIAVIVGFLSIGCVASLISTHEKFSLVIHAAKRHARTTIATQKAFVIFLLGLTVLAIGAFLIALPRYTIQILWLGLVVVSLECLWAGKLMRTKKNQE